MQQGFRSEGGKINENPKISIIIPIGRPETAGATIESVFSQSCLPEDIEIICVGSALFTLESRFRDPRMRYVSLDQRLNPAQTRMTGVAQSTGEIYLFVDDDIELDPHVIEQLLRVVAHRSDLGAVGARLPGTDNAYFSRVTDFANFWSQQSLRSGTRKWLYSAVLAVPAKVYLEVGGFNPELAIGEDVDLTTRIVQAHYAVLYQAEIVGYHNHRRTTFRSAVSYFWHNGGLARLCFQLNPQLRCCRISIALRTVLQWTCQTLTCNKEASLRLFIYSPGIILMYLVMSVSLEYHYQKYMKEYVKEKVTSDNLWSYPVKEVFLKEALRRETTGHERSASFFFLLCHCRELLYLVLFILLLYILWN